MQIPLVDLKQQYQEIKKEILPEIGRVLEGMQLFLGSNVQTVESEFAAYCNCDYAVGVGSGTDALHIALLACGIGRGDEVITTSNTFIATAEAIVLAGARPVLVDIDPYTYNMDPSLIEQKITPRTKAIIPVHMYGHPADMDPIVEVARAHNLKVIEDACQAHGAEYKGRKTGSLGDIGCFSFYCTKNLGTYGEAGIITTSSPELARLCRILRDHGQSRKYIHALMGVNGRLDEIQAAILKVKMRYLDGWTESRRRLARFYDVALPSFVVKPLEMSWTRHVYHLYVIRTAQRDELRDWLGSQGVSTGIHYPIPIHLQNAWRETCTEECSLPVTEKVTQEIVSLPIYPELSEEAAQYVCDRIWEFAKEESRTAV